MVSAHSVSLPVREREEHANMRGLESKKNKGKKRPPAAAAAPK